MSDSLATGSSVFHRTFDLVSVVGPGATAFLHSQVTSDLESVVAAGASNTAVDTLILEPSGKVAAIAVCRWTSSEQRWDLFVEHGYGSRVIERLQRFFLRVKAELTLQSRTCSLIDRSDLVSDDVLVSTPAPLFFLGLALLNDAGEVNNSSIAGVDLSSAIQDDIDRWERRRLRLCTPSMSHELLRERVPASLGSRVMARAVSLTKGCYTGQELVARMDARQARPPETIVAARIPSDELSSELRSRALGRGDTALIEIQMVDGEGQSIGEVTSLGIDDHGELRVLGFRRRSFADEEILRLVVNDVLYSLEVVDAVG